MGGSRVGTNLAHDLGFVLHRGDATLAPVLTHGALAARDGSRASGNQGGILGVVRLAAQHGALGLDVLARGRTERHGARGVVRDAIRDGRRRADDLARRSRRAGRAVVPRAGRGAAVIGRERDALGESISRQIVSRRTSNGWIETVRSDKTGAEACLTDPARRARPLPYPAVSSSEHTRPREHLRAPTLPAPPAGARRATLPIFPQFQDAIHQRG